MILSLLTINRIQLAKIIKANCGKFDIYTAHKLVYTLFPEEEAGRDFLFKYKETDYGKRIVILSQREPDISLLPKENCSIKFRHIPDSYFDAEYYRFEVQINPVKRDMKTGKIIPVKGRNELVSWFCTKAVKYGFEVMPDTLSVDNTDTIIFKKGDSKITLGKAVFSGVLKVKDKEIFMQSFKKGLGKGKSFGFGLLEIVPNKGE